MEKLSFRAWLRNEKEMVEVLEIDFYNKKVAYVCTEQVSENELEQTREVDTFDNVILLQSTGLEDKRDVEIYEGDICKDEHGDLGVIKLMDVDDWDGEIHRGWFLEKVDGWAASFMDGYGQTNVEVVGNIYENPELMEEDE